MSRIPIRLRLTLAFGAAMAVVLAATGLFLLLRFEAELDARVDEGLRARAGDVGALVRGAGARLTGAGAGRLAERGESFAQVLSPAGRVVDATPGLRAAPLLRGAELRRALASPITLERDGVVERGDPTRLLATPVEAGGRRLVVVVGASLDDNEEALASLGLLLLIGGPAALALALLAGYGVARAALRPVEAMRAEAEAISEREPGRRLPVPPAHDEIAQLGTTLNAMLARLEAAFARERGFVNDASHELRTPLAILKAELELALRQGRSPAELRASLRSATEEADRLAQLAEDLLAIARFDDGRLPLRAAPLDAGELLAGVAKRFERRFDDAGRRLAVEAPARLRLDADRRLLEQALGNLLDNALRHGAGEVRLEAEARDGLAILQVRDGGAGFPTRFLPDAFERFSRADEARGRGGAGLGLAIVRAVAEAHGGRAGAANGPRGGADVWIELPLRGGAAPAGAAADARPRASSRTG